MGCGWCRGREPRAGKLLSLPPGMRVFLDNNSRYAVIVSDVNVEATLALASSHGACVSAEGLYGRLFSASLYCEINQEL